MLDHFATEFTTRYIDTADAEGQPLERLERLAMLVATDERPDAERAVRAWATQSTEVHEVQAQIDRTRIEYLRGLCQQLAATPEDSSQMARLLHLVLIGVQHSNPPVTGEELRVLYAFILRKVLGDDQTLDEERR
ncbi:hypothetical protein [Saccharopolyspora sp. NPDC050642]|uniref:hypothetical protein n=1 Tax=Saccharopolyspora sp. NPDC050642 TaxID=3157099 RepID=UPI0033D41771